tara:strand:- start:3713 stop:4615 length:903 start_codon:yes stop_codon:yes gene_type:complete
MNRSGLKSICMALMLWLMPVGAVAQNAEPGTLCSDGTLGSLNCIRPQFFAFDTCQLIEDAARRHGLDAGFFARLLWQESRFDPHAISPAGAQGIAQFMPATAALRGLSDAFNPAEAMERSAHYLGELQRRYGNAGLAAVAYNGGERRADGFTQEDKGLVQETWDYVRIITGLGAEQWRDDPPEAHDFRLDTTLPFMPACLALAKNRRITPLKSPLKPWSAQLAYGKTRAQAQANVKRLTAQCSGRVARETVEYVTVPNRVRGQPPYHLGRIARDTKEGAEKICATLRRDGCLCRVLKHKG